MPAGPRALLPPRVHPGGIATARHSGGALPFAVYRCRLPAPLSWAGERGRLEVPLDRITTAVGFAYGDAGWHPHVETLRALRVGRGPADLRDTPLGRLYAAFCPRTVREAVLDDVDDPVPGLTGVPLVRGQLRELWNPHGPRPADPTGALDRPGLYWGPAPAEHLEREVERTLALHRDLAATGLRDDGPGRHAISGYLLVRDGDYRFIAHEGHHRLACLAALGHPTAPVYLSPKAPPIVDAGRLGRWTRGRRARYAPASAELLLDRLFESTGREKASRLGLLDDDAVADGSRA